MNTPLTVDVVYDPTKNRYLDLGIDAADRWVYEPQDATNFHGYGDMLIVLYRYPGTVIRRFYAVLTPSTATTPEGLLEWYQRGCPMNYSDCCARE